jgi:hypothetical protein
MKEQARLRAQAAKLSLAVYVRLALEKQLQQESTIAA